MRVLSTSRRRCVFPFEIDHVISEKHGGVTSATNLALSCLFCNRNKGSDIATLATNSLSLVRLFNPRLDLWGDHFRLSDDLRILGVTEVGQATTRILDFNTPDRIQERLELRIAGRFPSAAATTVMRRTRS
ncbi:MAG: HNH endonuclease signature motif containing protein [Capsulimonadaceae bacterium]